MRADAMYHLPENRFGTSFEKPKFPVDVNINSKLADFVTQDSWVVFYKLKLEIQLTVGLYVH
jgi:hypothetical protein